MRQILPRESGKKFPNRQEFPGIRGRIMVSAGSELPASRLRKTG
jgi:hypothetical protein